MLQVTDDAKSLLKDLLGARPADSDVIRLSKEDDKFRLRFEPAAEGDTVFNHEGTDVLAVAPDIAGDMEDLTIGMEDTADGPRLSLVQ